MDEVPWRSKTGISLDGYPLMILDHVCCPGCQTPRKPRHPLESHPRPRSSQRFRPGGSSSLQGCCNHLPSRIPYVIVTEFAYGRTKLCRGIAAQYDCTNTRGMKYRTGTSTYCLLPTLPCPALPCPAAEIYPCAWIRQFIGNSSVVANNSFAGLCRKFIDRRQWKLIN